MDAINTLQDSGTIILIAHRLSILKDCENISLLDRDGVIYSGSYKELVKRSSYLMN
jgi:ABC-type multidrug transport system fused ATPase/permease subunit